MFFYENFSAEGTLNRPSNLERQGTKIKDEIPFRQS